MDSNSPFSSLGTVNWLDGSLSGAQVHESVKTVGQLVGAFHEREEAERLDPSTVIYRVQWFAPEPAGTDGGLYWGNTAIEPGRIGDEYFMTHGHFHGRRDRGEFYATVQGEGALILMDATRRTWFEKMTPGSLHYIRGDWAHRVANTGAERLRFLACWPTDAGHDYESIALHGFGARMLCREGRPTLVESAS